jgi:two-component system osmolarity sensor histidine kinase EnvZ
VNLFWRTFLLLGALLVGSGLAWLQTFRALEFEPKALQSAQQLASLVNLTRAGLQNSDEIARIALVKTLVDEEDLRIAVREPSDTFKPFDNDRLSERIAELLRSKLGADTVVAREVNGFKGMWVGFTMGRDAYWLLADPSRVEAVHGRTWLTWLSIAALLSLAGAALMASLISRPLKRLAQATRTVARGDFHSSRLDESVRTPEIRTVNAGFNHMTDRLQQIEQDRALMLAGISHDLRTPLARIRLEAEISVADHQARALMGQDIDQVDAIIDQFMDYARPSGGARDTLHLRELLHSCADRLAADGVLRYTLDVPTHLRLVANPTELQRVVNNLLHNAVRYGQTADTGVSDVALRADMEGHQVRIDVRDHGPGVPPEALPRLTQPFYRVDESRSQAKGTGLGLAIVQRHVQRMGGHMTITLPADGGLCVSLWLPSD